MSIPNSPRIIQWSKIKSRIKEFILPALRSRVDFHLTRYREAHDQVGRAWVTVDGEEVLDASYYVWLREYEAAFSEACRLFPEEEPPTLVMQVGYQLCARTERATELLAARAVHEPGQVYGALREYPSLPVSQTIASPNPLIRALAMLDRRVGRRTLAKVNANADDHPLVRRFHELRMSADGA